MRIGMDMMLRGDAMGVQILRFLCGMQTARNGNKHEKMGHEMELNQCILPGGVNDIVVGSHMTAHVQVRFQNEVPDCEDCQRGNLKCSWLHKLTTGNYCVGPPSIGDRCEVNCTEGWDQFSRRADDGHTV